MTLIYLLLAIIFEVGWATGMKLSHGLSRPGPTAFTVVAYILSLVFLALATRKLDVGVAYSIWAGMGAATIAVIGVLYFREPMTAVKAASIGLIVLGVVGLQLTGPGH